MSRLFEDLNDSAKSFFTYHSCDPMVELMNKNNIQLKLRAKVQIVLKNLTLLVLIIFGSMACGSPHGEIKRSEESVLDVPPVPLRLEKPKGWIFPPKYVEAGYFPGYVGDEIHEGYPVVETFSPEDREKALQLDWTTGYADRLNDFTGRSTWFGFLKGKSVVFVVEDLMAEGVDLEDPNSVASGLIKLFHIKLETPGFESKLPSEATLHVKLIDHDIDHHGKDIVLETTLALQAKNDGDYYFANPKKAMKTFQDLEAEAAEIAEETFYSGKGRELKLIKITGVNDSTKVENMPEIEGVIMTHKVFFGSFQVESGWQWFGRPDGLFQARQPGFIQ